MFFWNSLAFSIIQWMLAFSKSSLNIWKFMVHIPLKLGLENFEHYFASMWDECNCAVFWALFGIVFLWDWNENWKMNGNWWIEFKWPLYLLLWQETLGRTVVALIVQNVILGCNLKNDRMISVSFQGDPFNITGIKSMPQSLMWWLYPWTSPDAQ